MYYPKTKKTRTKTRFTKKRTVKAKTTDKHLKAVIKKEIHRVAEDKKALPLQSQVAISTPAAIPPGLSFQMQYTIIGINGIDSLVTLGTGQGNRIGNKITPRGLSLNGFLIPLNNTSGLPAVLPMIARMVIYRAKDNLYPINYTVGATTFNPFSTVFQNGNSTLAPNNTYYDIMYKMNKDKYIVYKEKIFKVGTSINTPTATTSAPNNDFKLDNRYKINLSKHLKKLTYDDSTVSNASHAMHCIIFFCVYDNSALTANTNYIQTFYNVELDYEDI